MRSGAEGRKGVPECSLNTMRLTLQLRGVGGLWWGGRRWVERSTPRANHQALVRPFFSMVGWRSRQQRVQAGRPPDVLGQLQQAARVVVRVIHAPAGVGVWAGRGGRGGAQQLRPPAAPGGRGAGAGAAWDSQQQLQYKIGAAGGAAQQAARSLQHRVLDKDVVAVPRGLLVLWKQLLHGGNQLGQAPAPVDRHDPVSHLPSLGKTRCVPCLPCRTPCHPRASSTLKPTDLPANPTKPHTLPHTTRRPPRQWWRAATPP